MTARSMAAPIPPLVATSPGRWLAVHQPKPEGGVVGPWIDRDGLLADGPEGIAASHRLVVERGAQPAPAACYLSEWIGGTLAGNVGHALALGHVGFDVDAESVRWHRHAQGWLDGVDLSAATAVVDRTHPWAGRADVDVVETRAEVIARAVRSVIATAEPVIDAIRSLAPVGRPGLWNEVADGFAMSICFDRSLPVDATAVEILHEAITQPGRPWNATPTIRISTATFGPCYVAQKGGCCLAYTNTSRPLDADGSVDYCSTCRFRTWDDCEGRQLRRFEESVVAGQHL